MLAALLAVVLSADPCPDRAPDTLTAGVAARVRYWRWLHSYPYSTTISQHGCFDYRNQQDYPWSVRSGYSLPNWAAADSRVLRAASPEARGAAREKISPSRSGPTSSR